MKKQIHLLFLIIPFFCFSQVGQINFSTASINFLAAPRTTLSPMSIKLWDNYNNGGPTTYGTVLEIYGKSGHQTGQLYFGGGDNSKIRYREAFYNQTAWNSWITMLDSKNDVQSAGNLKITGNANSYILNGNVGIGTTTPSNTQGWNKVLDVAGTGNAKILVTADNSTFKTGIFSHSSWNGGGGFVGTESNNTLFLIAGYDPKVTILTNGNVGIGTQSPDEKLTVKGKIHTQEVRVDMAGPLVPDYVFANDYKLKTLQEVEAYIKQNSHLPEIPSAQEIEKNGLMLAEMNMMLLKKMEEMTLYMIEQNKRIEKLEKTLKK